MSSKRANGEGTIRQRKNGSWEGLYTAGRDENGKLIRRSVYGKTKTDVARKLIAVTNDLNQGIYVAPDRITVGEWFDIFLKEYNRSVKASTIAQYEYQIRKNIKPTLGTVPLQKLTTPMIQKLYNVLSDTLSAKSIKNLHGVMHKGLNQAVRCQYIKSNPCLACELPRVEKHEMLTITGNDLRNFLNEIKGKPFEWLYYVDVFTGMREGEIIGLTWDCIDFNKGIIEIKKQMKRERKLSGSNEYIFDSLKNGKSRVISPAPNVFSALKKVRMIQRENQLKHGSSFKNQDNLVFTDEYGNHLCAPTVWSNFKKRAEAIGLPAVRFHDLRHSFATLSLENGDDAKTVSENLGHATVAFTLDVYGHVTDKMKKESANRMQSLIEALEG